MNYLLEINNLRTYFYSKRGVAKAVNGVDLKLGKGEILGVIGESGSGKSVMVKSIMRLIKKPGKIVDGNILFEKEDLLNKNLKEVRKIRGNKISMIFQEPMTSLNPVLKIGDQLTEGILYHTRINKKEAIDKVLELLAAVKIPEPESILQKYSYQLSGGMRQPLRDPPLRFLHDMQSF